MKNVVIFIIFILVLNGCLYGQEQTQFSQYIYTQGLQNPAYNGTRGHLSGVLLYRNQWVGLKGAPVTQGINVHSPVGKTNLGVGLSVINEDIGYNHNIVINLALSYIVQLNEKNFLSFGLQGGIDRGEFKLEDNIDISADPIILDAINNHSIPQFGVGVLFYNEKAFFGFSVPKLMQKDHLENTIKITDVHYFIYGGYLFDLSSSLKLKPSLFIKSVVGAPTEFDLNTELLFKKKYGFGIGYRSQAAFIFTFNIALSEMFKLGYAYDFPITEINNVSGGTHEIRFTFDLIKEKISENKGTLSPRYF